MTFNRLDGIKKRLNKATPGRWVAEPDLRPDVMAYVRCDNGVRGGYFDEGQLVKRIHGKYQSACAMHVAEFAKYEKSNDDAEFVANAPSDLAWCIEEIERLTRKLKENL